MDNSGDTHRSVAVLDSQPASTPELLDKRAVVALLGGCSTRHLYRMVDAGRMPRPLKLGGLVRWRRTDVLDWIRDGCPPVRAMKGTTYQKN